MCTFAITLLLKSGAYKINCNNLIRSSRQLYYDSTWDFILQLQRKITKANINNFIAMTSSMHVINVLLDIGFASEVQHALAHRRGEATVRWPAPQTLKMKKSKAKPSSFRKSKAGFPQIFGIRPGFQFSVLWALPIKLICDVTQLCRNFGPPRKLSAYAICSMYQFFKGNGFKNCW